MVGVLRGVWTAIATDRATIRIISVRRATNKRGFAYEQRKDNFEFEELFDEGCDVTGFFDFDSAVVVEEPRRSVNVDMPIWMVEASTRKRSAWASGGRP